MELPAAHPVLPTSRRRPGRLRLASACLGLAMVGTLVAGLGVPAHAVSGNSLEGIDLSHYNGAVDWAAVKNAGIKFAFVKATESTSYPYTKYYDDNRAAAAKAHVTFGAYHFARPSGSTTTQINADGRAEADYFIDVAAPKPGDLLPALDLESRNDGLTVSERQTWVWAFLNEVVARIHEKPIIYSGYSFWHDYMGDTTEYADAGFKLLWAPSWFVSSPKIPAMNWGGYGWTFWQYTDGGSVPGISGGVDRDKFNGTDLTPVEVGTPPSTTSPPTVSGTQEETAVLTAGNGEWAGTAPFTFAYRWRRCDSGGGACAYIPGATGKTYTLTAADVNTLVSVEVTATNQLGSAVAESAQTRPIAPYDVTPPSVPAFTAPATRYLTTTSVPVAWSSTDDKSGVASYALRDRVAAATGAFGPLAMMFKATSQTSTTLTAAPGRSYCFSAKATDRWHNVSAWSGERCVTVPFDDRAMTTSTGWARIRNPAFYLGSALSTTRRWATLTREDLIAHRIRVVAETCPDCGQIRVRWNNELIGTFDLTSQTTYHRRVLHEIVLPAVQTGTLQIRVVSARRQVVIDGVAVTQL
jgi:GH25 family lysozyme M1 (1,4-beta-N-acetylmuramidase)